jgi:hypothetical protein
MVMMVNLKYGGVVQLERGRVGGGCGASVRVGEVVGHGGDEALSSLPKTKRKK